MKYSFQSFFLDKYAYILAVELIVDQDLLYLLPLIFQNYNKGFHLNNDNTFLNMLHILHQFLIVLENEVYQILHHLL